MPTTRSKSEPQGIGPRKKVFISHSSADRDLANALQDLLTRSSSLHHDDFYNSDAEGSNTPGGRDFVQDIRRTLGRTGFIIHIVTPAYLASDWCKWEFGATWVKRVPSFPIRTSRITDDQLPAPIEHDNVANFDAVGLNRLSEALKSDFGVRVNANLWEVNRKAFMKRLSKCLARSDANYRALPTFQADRSGRYAAAMLPVHQAFHELRDIAASRLIRYTQDHEHGSDIHHMLSGLRRSLNAFETAFSTISGTECRCCIKIMLLPGPDKILYVSDLLRSTQSGKKPSPKPRDRIDENTDFENIVHRGADYFYCNDLKNLKGYKNSHEGFSYQSTIVWPIRKLLENPNAVDVEHQRITETADLIAFLCVDAEEKAAFAGAPEPADAATILKADPQEDVALGAAYADSLYPVIQPYFGDLSELYKQQPKKSLADRELTGGSASPPHAARPRVSAKGGVSTESVSKPNVGRTRDRGGRK